VSVVKVDHEVKRTSALVFAKDKNELVRREEPHIQHLDISIADLQTKFKGCSEQCFLVPLEQLNCMGERERAKPG
jgi:hypothetical protein